ncbi:hypothetical protein K466DRAFT_13978 [Polyporus arcularius HHB13444]|uniref:Uncharacterized protein n=1 Tax=Polyporus arcularius HHB13444 TaxID=1314778 RepID=A0A5C3P1A5_9APHY|nr:hypothetical protein K466DRAFT_13978 [Polyporus arcularius HHB13444]
MTGRQPRRTRNEADRSVRPPDRNKSLSNQVDDHPSSQDLGASVIACIPSTINCPWSSLSLGQRAAPNRPGFNAASSRQRVYGVPPSLRTEGRNLTIPSARQAQSLPIAPMLQKNEGERDGPTAALLSAPRMTSVSCVLDAGYTTRSPHHVPSHIASEITRL